VKGPSAILGKAWFGTWTAPEFRELPLAASWGNETDSMFDRYRIGDQEDIRESGTRSTPHALAPAVHAERSASAAAERALRFHELVRGNFQDLAPLVLLDAKLLQRRRRLR
jgi:hypothetical protein